MRIQNNIMAMNAYRNYTNNTSALSKNLEKLSSGYKINRAGDDAAGLAISEKMRAQITGLDVAQKNAKDGISLVQTAEGALTEVHDMLNRMVELASQSANGTYDNETDRDNLQKEMDQLLSEIDRIADSSNFNGINLLDGTMEAGADATKVGQFTVGGNLPGVGDVLGTNTVLAQKPADNDSGTTFSIDLHNYSFSNAAGEKLTIDIGGTKLELHGNDGTKLEAADIVNAIVTGAAGTATGNVSVNGVADAAGTGKITINGQSFTMSDGGNGRLTFTQDAAPTDASQEVNGDMKVTISGTGAATASVFTTGALTQTGSTGSAATKVTINYTDADGAAKSKEITFNSDTAATGTFSALKTAIEADTDLKDLFTVGGSDTAGMTLTSKVAGAKVGVTGITVTSAGTDTVAIAAGKVTTAGADSSVLSDTGDYNVSTTDITNVKVDSGERLASTSFILTQNMVKDGATITIGKTTYTFKTDKDSTVTGDNVIDISDLETTDNNYLSQVSEKLTQAAANNTTYTVGHDGSRITVTEKKGQTDFTNLDTVEGIESSLGFSGPKVTGNGLVLQIGDTSDSYNQLTVDIQDMHADALGIANLDISEQGSAQAAIDKLKAAINTVSSVRGTLGATQNRLDHTINNLSVMQENIQDAESTIRDTDVAEEMMAYTKNNILIQSAQAMLAQANQVPQGVLQLLQ